ncbi:hypothetical protein C9374_010479 [Naegleria lovaniensis]|uniref:Uncharacterized protein n=1 Tax=Naegleria lovaniensis TaxID=51637 RepID=A0AA88KDI0_NAELO|nr:uncharacterized protein C9374_010479 [Naegleria lovaniensis]KAG2374735.1 hypothetical protein C9374_010479 [Naegleria lovaniensis]
MSFLTTPPTTSRKLSLNNVEDTSSLLLLQLNGSLTPHSASSPLSSASSSPSSSTTSSRRQSTTSEAGMLLVPPTVGSLTRSRSAGKLEEGSTSPQTARKPPLLKADSFRFPTSMDGKKEQEKSLVREYQKALLPSTKIYLTSAENDMYSISSSLHAETVYEPQVEHLGAPILFTACHGHQVYRGGKLSDDEKVHLKESLTSEIALLLAAKVRNMLHSLEGSFVVWNMKTIQEEDISHMDPNYLLPHQYCESPFHLFLHKFKNLYKGIPMLHVDIHGKVNRRDNRNIDVGFAPMMEYWSNSIHAKLLKDDFCKRLTNAVALCTRSINGFKIGIEKEPQQNGWRGENAPQTLSHQSVLLGIPAVQLEIPYDVRKELVENEAFLEEIAKAITECYKITVCKMYDMNWQQCHQQIVNVNTENDKKTLRLTSTKHHHDHVDDMFFQMLTEFAEMEKKQASIKQI